MSSSNGVQPILQEFVARDQRCCPFLDFKVAEDDGGIQLDVSGPPAAAEVLDVAVDVFDAARRDAAARG